MTTYRIIAPHFVAAIIEDAGTVLQAPPVIGWTVGRDFPGVRDYFQQHGWKIQPVIPSSEVIVQAKYRDDLYEFAWGEDGVILRITRHNEDGSRDIHWNSVPASVRKALL